MRRLITITLCILLLNRAYGAEGDVKEADGCDSTARKSPAAMALVPAPSAGAAIADSDRARAALATGIWQHINANSRYPTPSHSGSEPFSLPTGLLIDRGKSLTISTTAENAYAAFISGSQGELWVMDCTIASYIARFAYAYNCGAIPRAATGLLNILVPYTRQATGVTIPIGAIVAISGHPLYRARHYQGTQQGSNVMCVGYVGDDPLFMGFSDSYFNDGATSLAKIRSALAEAMCAPPSEENQSLYEWFLSGDFPDAPSQHIAHLADMHKQAQALHKMLPLDLATVLREISERTLEVETLALPHK